VARVTLDKKPTEVASMFDEVAIGYDQTRAWLWWGHTDSWGERMAKAANAGPGQRILDVAAGTGASAAILARHGANVVASDISPGMLAACRRRHNDLETIVADAHQLPFDPQVFDAVTISFGLRNMARPQLVVSEMLRVTRPGGRLVVCEFSMPPRRIPRMLFRLYLDHVVPFVSRRVSSNPEAYQYLAESIQVWPAPEVVGQWIAQAGWEHVTWRPLDGGVVHLHSAVAPSAQSLGS
jgi:demethylmenaquinone methyltransferase / 2-methoxy-6-polyprenyl-1,4-benzoquinol methylase